MNPQPLGIKDGLKAGFPILIGYFPAAMAFGLLAKTTGLSCMESWMFSVFVFAGASQFIALSLLQSGVAGIEIVIATFLINLRHLLMSAALTSKFPGKIKWPLWVAFGVTDETFSVAVIRNEPLTTPFLLAVELSAYVAWVAGTVFGYYMGALLPETVQASMGITLYAMFVAILIPEVRQTGRAGLMALGAGLLHLGLGRLKLLPQGWNIVIAIVTVSAAGALFVKEPDAKEAVKCQSSC
jgi:4-azaleucine resistance transporter AzlC